MKRLLPLWVIAIVPATLAGHLFDYAVAGRDSTGGVHFWITPAMQLSLALLAGLCLTLLGAALLNARPTRAATEQSTLQLWIRLAVAQTAMFAVMEHVEGNHLGLVGCLVQIVVALFVAYALTRFDRLLARCACATEEASRYFERVFAAMPAFFVTRQPHAVACALAVRAGSSRFQRPPPNV